MLVNAMAPNVAFAPNMIALLCRGGIVMVSVATTREMVQSLDGVRL
jgi:hypothetical protein